MGVTGIRFPVECGIGIKPVSKEGTYRLVRRALQYAIDNDKPSVTLVHKGNIMKFTGGAFRDWGNQITREEFAGRAIPWDDCDGNPPDGEVLVRGHYGTGGECVRNPTASRVFRAGQSPYHLLHESGGGDV